MAFLLELAAECAIENGCIAEAILNRLCLDPLIADHLHLNLIALLIEAEVLKPQKNPHPCSAADAGDGKSFAAEIFGSLDVGPDDQIVGVAAGETGDEFKIVPAGNGCEHGAAAGAADMDVAGC